MRQRDVFLDEVALDALFTEGDSRERPVERRVFTLTLAVVTLIALLAAGRIVVLGIVQGKEYAARALENVNRVSILAAERGLITDRNGTPLVENVPISSIFVRPSEMVRYGEQKGVERVLELVRVEAETLRQAVEEGTRGSANLLLIKKDVLNAEAIAVQAMGLRSILVQGDWKRVAPPEFAHVVGYTGLPNRSELTANAELTHLDTVGKTGLELVFDESLRGVSGSRVEYRNVRGEVLDDRVVSQIEAGSELKTTIDAELERYLYARLKEAVVSGGVGPGAVGIALDPTSGEVRALVSLPSFSSNEVAQSLSDPRLPLFNRATSGVYNPGSTVKPIVGVAALEEGIVEPGDRFFSSGALELPNPYAPDKPSRFLDWKAHGWVDLAGAIARSSNVYFYYVGGGFKDVAGLGIERLRKYYALFGFGEPTGIELPNEARGFLPSPEEKEKRSETPWRVGDTYNVSIGQGDLAVTPLELLNAIASIVNGGTLYRTTIVAGKPHEVLRDYTHLASSMREVLFGMRDAVYKPYGTAHLLADLSLPIVGKTGSAQILRNTKINAFFVGCAPVAVTARGAVEIVDGSVEPICLLILIENAREGSANTTPVARDVFRWYAERDANGSDS